MGRVGWRVGLAALLLVLGAGVWAAAAGAPRPVMVDAGVAGGKPAPPADPLPLNLAPPPAPEAPDLRTTSPASVEVPPPVSQESPFGAWLWTWALAFATTWVVATVRRTITVPDVAERTNWEMRQVGTRTYKEKVKVKQLVPKQKLVGYKYRDIIYVDGEPYLVQHHPVPIYETVWEWEEVEQEETREEPIMQLVPVPVKIQVGTTTREEVESTWEERSVPTGLTGSWERQTEPDAMAQKLRELHTALWEAVANLRQDTVARLDQEIEDLVQLGGVLPDQVRAEIDARGRALATDRLIKEVTAWAVDIADRRDGREHADNVAWLVSKGAGQGDQQAAVTRAVLDAIRGQWEAIVRLDDRSRRVLKAAEEKLRALGGMPARDLVDQVLEQGRDRAVTALSDAWRAYWQAVADYGRDSEQARGAKARMTYLDDWVDLPPGASARDLDTYRGILGQYADATANNRPLPQKWALEALQGLERDMISAETARAERARVLGNAYRDAVRSFWAAVVTRPDADPGALERLGGALGTTGRKQIDAELAAEVAAAQQRLDERYLQAKQAQWDSVVKGGTGEAPGRWARFVSPAILTVGQRMDQDYTQAQTALKTWWQQMWAGNVPGAQDAAPWQELAARQIPEPSSWAYHREQTAALGKAYLQAMRDCWAAWAAGDAAGQAAAKAKLAAWEGFVSRNCPNEFAEASNLDQQNHVIKVAKEDKWRLIKGAAWYNLPWVKEDLAAVFQRSEGARHAGGNLDHVTAYDRAEQAALQKMYDEALALQAQFLSDGFREEAQNMNDQLQFWGGYLSGAGVTSAKGFVNATGTSTPLWWPGTLDDAQIWDVFQPSQIMSADLVRVVKGTPFESLVDEYLKAERRTGLNALFHLAKDVFETNWGKTRAFRDLRNTGGYRNANTGEFESFDTYAESIEHGADVLAGQLYKGSGSLTLSSIQEYYAPLSDPSDTQGLNSNWTKGIGSLLLQWISTLGIVGRHAPAGSLPLSLGSTGRTVRQVQEQLRRVYADVRPNGSYDRKTLAATLQFQMYNNLMQTGVLDAETLSLLNGPGRTSPPDCIIFPEDDGQTTYKVLAFRRVSPNDSPLKEGIDPRWKRVESAAVPEILSLTFSNGSGLVAPVSAPISDHPGNRENPLDMVVRAHAGTDYAAGAGTPVQAMYGGRVVKAGWDDSYGQHVIIEHFDALGRPFRSLYAHLESLNVAANENVSRGQQIGDVGSTGASTGAHLHVEIYQRKQGDQSTEQDIIYGFLQPLLEAMT